MAPLHSRLVKKERLVDLSLDKENEEVLQVIAGPTAPAAAAVSRVRHRPEPLSDVEDYAVARHLAVATASFLPEIVSSRKSSASSKFQHNPPQLSQFWTYAAGHGGSVEHWKKLARKAELEMHLEQEQHKSDREKDLDAIHRLRCRISALEGAALERDLLIDKQRRKISLLKSQLGSVNKRFGKEISILRNQSEHMQKKFASVTGVNEKKILELKEELQHSESRAKMVEYQLCLINKCIEEPLEMFNLTELPERAPDSIQQSNVAKSPKRSFKKQGSMEPEGISQGFDDFTMPKSDLTSLKEVTSDLIKKRPGRSTMAAKILQLRTENTALTKKLGQRDERLKTLFREAEHLRGQYKEAISSRNSALSQVREAEKLFEKLEAMEPLIVKAGILNEQGVDPNFEEYLNASMNKGHKPLEGEARQRSKSDSASRSSPETHGANLTLTLPDETKADVKFSRKQAFKRWSSILNEIRSALSVFVSKVHATSQLESSLRIERDALVTLASKLQQEVLTELDPRTLTLEGVAEMQSLRGEDQADNERKIEKRNYSNFKIDKDLIHRIILAVKEQKRKLLVTSGRVEDLKKEKISSEASLFKKQKKLSELEKKLENIGCEQKILLAHFKHVQKLLENLNTSDDQDGDMTTSNLDHADDLSLNSHEMDDNGAFKFREMGRKIKFLLEERNEMMALNMQLEKEKQALQEKFGNFRNAMKILDVNIENDADSIASFCTELKQIKSRGEEVEIFLKEASVYHEVITKNIRVLDKILAEGADNEASSLYEMDFLKKKPGHETLLQKEFIDAAVSIPDIIYRVNAMKNEQKDFKSHLNKVEHERDSAKSRLAEQEKLMKFSASSQAELADTKNALLNIYNFLMSDEQKKESGDISNIDLGSTILNKIEQMKKQVDLMVADNILHTQKIEEFKHEISSGEVVLIEDIRSANILKEDILKGLQAAVDASKLQSLLKSDPEISTGRSYNEASLVGKLSVLRNCLEETQKLRKEEKALISEETCRLKQEIGSVKVQLEEHARHSKSSSSDWNEKLRLLTEALDTIKHEKESLATELSVSLSQLKDLRYVLQRTEEESAARVSKHEQEITELNQQRNALLADLEKARLQSEEQKNALLADLDKVRLQNQEQKLLFENSRKELLNKVENLEKEMSKIHVDHAGTLDSAEELRKVIDESKRMHEQAIKEWKERTEFLQNEVARIKHHNDALKLDLKSFESRLKDKELMLENLQKIGDEKAAYLQQELALAVHERSGSGNEVMQLRNLMKEQELAAKDFKSECTEKIEKFEQSLAQTKQERERLIKELEQVKKVAEESEAKSNEKLKTLKQEVLRLGGFDIGDETEKRRRHTACEKMKEILAAGTLSDPSLPKVENKGKDQAVNPLRRLAVFQVDLLVNSKAHKQLEVSGSMGGLSQAAIHYFALNQQSGDITFENGNQPGSQSSNMVAELILSTSEAPIYETKAGDVLGLSVKVKSMNDKTAREILYNTNVIRTDEIMEAIKGQPIDNFSLWPDLVSSWKWERSTSKGWVLVCIKWRFLFKNIFPEISEPLQILVIKQGS